MTWQATAWVAEHSEATKGARCLMFAIANHANAEGRRCIASVETLAHEARLSRRGAQEALRRLEASGEIEAVGSSPYGTTDYRIVGMEGGAESAPPADEGGAVRDKGGAVRDKVSSSTAPKRSTVGMNVHTSKDAREVEIEGVVLSGPWANVLTALQRVADAKGAELDLAGAVKQCEKFADRAHSIEAERFAEYWIEGRGENRPMRKVVFAWRNWLSTAPAATTYRSRNGRTGQPTSGELRELAAAAREAGR